jgi:hypothetical protein
MVYQDDDSDIQSVASGGFSGKPGLAEFDALKIS